MSDTAIELMGVTVEGALHDVTLTVPAARVTAVVGPNGAGKSSLLRACLGGPRTGGSVAWFNRPLQQWSRRELARRVALLAQSPAWEPDETVAACLASGRSPHWGAFGAEADIDRDAAEKVVHRLGLQPWLTRRIGTLSGGERQRVLLGRTLTQIEGQATAAVLLDEPDAYLDVAKAAELATQVRALEASGRTVLIASHNLGFAAEVADNVVLLKGGRVVVAGRPREVLTDEHLRSAYGVEVLTRWMEGRLFVLPPMS